MTLVKCITFYSRNKKVYPRCAECYQINWVSQSDGITGFNETCRKKFHQFDFYVRKCQTYFYNEINGCNYFSTLSQTWTHAQNMKSMCPPLHRLTFLEILSVLRMTHFAPKSIGNEFSISIM